MNSIPLQIDQIGHTTEFLHPTGLRAATSAISTLEKAQPKT
jgi:hypothetical protein